MRFNRPRHAGDVVNDAMDRVKAGHPAADVLKTGDLFEPGVDPWGTFAAGSGVTALLWAGLAMQAEEDKAREQKESQLPLQQL